MLRSTLLVASLSLALVGLASAQSSSPKAAMIAGALGAKVIDTQIADFNGDGRPDALVVVEGATPKANRDVVLLIRNADGQLQRVAHNNRLVPCATCAGSGGDPYQGIRMRDDGEFTIVIGGGGREKWTDSYSFLYESQYKDWLFTQVNRDVEDTETGETGHVHFGATDIGGHFSDFDPKTVPAPELTAKAAWVNPYAPKTATPTPSAAPSLACPAADFPSFFIAFSNSETVQRAFISEPFFSQTVEDMQKNSDGEPSAVTRKLMRSQVQFPLIPSIKEQVQEGLTIQQTYPTPDQVKVQISKDDTDYQMTLTFRKVGSCWQATRLVDDTI